jgi:hypothetical protein
LVYPNKHFPYPSSHAIHGFLANSLEAVKLSTHWCSAAESAPAACCVRALLHFISIAFGAATLACRELVSRGRL